ncbi:IclR family transcriptional regulator [Delftia tsuruhatensis]|uniref:IclR family transcriptional regulator n=1 Tax=Delftia tsuruhatensis TaxID=180282 RepID=UPI001EF4C61A|nr:IclR family transcriptional regulator [Delftia tsuruhatensis]
MNSASAPETSEPIPTRERRQRVQAAETCLAVLKALATLGGRASLTAIGVAVEESPAKVHRYLASLMAEGLVEQDRGGTQYALASEAIRVGLAAMRQCDPIRVAEPALVHLREALQVTSFVAVMGNLGPTIVRFEEPGLPVTVNVRVGSVMSLLWSATGRAFFAFMDDDARVDALLAQELAEAPPARRALLDAEDPLGVLRREIRAAGCAAIRDVNLPGISAVAAPLHDYTGHVVGVLCALGASGGFDPDPRGAVAQAVRAQAGRVSASLGYLCA